MAKSAQLEFDYLIGAQTQKHLTVNNALARLDAFSQLVLEDVDVTLPSAISTSEGKIWGVGVGVEQFSGKNQQVAIFLNGGFEFVTPKKGWRAFVKSRNQYFVFNGMNWQADAGVIKFLDFEHDISQNALETVISIPERAMVFGVSSRVTQAISGPSAQSFSMGVEGALDRYGSGLWLGLDGINKGVSGTPVTYWHDTPLVLSADAGDLVEGKLLIKIAYFDLPLP